jgi:transketolase
MTHLNKLHQKAGQLRCRILEMGIASGGHIASAFSCVEILVALYHGGIIRIDSKRPTHPERDRFIMSKGHGETGLYAVLADMGFFSRKWLDTCYRKGNCRLGGHPDHKIPGVEISSGSLGHGLGIGAGLALAARMDGLSRKHIVLLGDAECTEGSVWEAAMFAAKQGLYNLVAVVDRNHIGSLDYTVNYTGLEPFDAKWRAFGWETHICDGHSIEKLLEGFGIADSFDRTRPFVLIAETVKGKGVSFMENDPIWHVKNLSDTDEIACARRELEEASNAGC